MKDREEMVDELISNADSVWTEDERDFLMGLGDEQIEGLYEGLTGNAISEKKASGVEGASDSEDDESEDGKTDDKAGSKTAGGKQKVRATKAIACKNSKAKVSDEDEEGVENDEDVSEEEATEAFIEKAPPSLREVLREGVAAVNEEKAECIAVILANEDNDFEQEELESKPLRELRALAKLAGPAKQQTAKPAHNARKANYEGRGLSQDELHQNAEEAEVLPMPTMNFSDDEKPSNRKGKLRTA